MFPYLYVLFIHNEFESISFDNHSWQGCKKGNTCTLSMEMQITPIIFL